MSNYIVSARKYRPATFDTVVGQAALTTTLKNAIESGKLAHAYLFCGPRGVGKTTCARIFAKTINCAHRNEAGEACDQCESCMAFNEQRSLNIHELDAASNNSVDDMRQLIEQVQVPPQIGQYKVFIIDEVHMLSTAAFNAFLKTLEEPPAHAIFILATTEKHKILPTILSRCQTYDFNRMDIANIVGHLRTVAEKEGIKCEEEALNMIAQKADGGMRDALSIFDQVASFTGGNITYQKVIEDLNVLDYDYYFKLTEQCLAADVTGAMITLNDVLSRGFQANHFMSGLACHFRNLLMARDPQTLHLLETSEKVRADYANQAKKCSPRMLYSALRLCNQCDLNYRQSTNKRLLVELTLIQVAQLSEPAGDDAAGSGLGPTKILKPIFQALVASVAAKAQAAPTPASSPAASVAPLSITPPVERAIPSASGLYTAPQGSARTVNTVSIKKILATNQTEPHALTNSDMNVVTSNRTGTSPKAPTAPDLPFTQEDFKYIWMRYAMQLPIEQAANAGRMKNMNPIVTEGNNEVEIPVENERVKTYIEQILPSILDYVRRELSNSLITIKLKVEESAEQEIQFLSPQELLDDLTKEEHIDKLVKLFALEID